MKLNRSLGTVGLAAGIALLAGCTSSGTISGSPSAQPLPSVAISVGTISSSAVCDLLTSSDVQTAIGESVTSTRPLTGASAAAAAQIQECVLATNGPLLNSGQAAALNLLTSAVTGGNGNAIDLTTGGIAIIEANTSFAVTASPTVSTLPSGAAAVPGVGRQAYVYASPTGGGLAFSQITESKAILVVDIEGKPITVDQLTALLKAAAARA